jgi:dolichyl-diphosphooligosaccharide---protein glycosyltransferase
LVDKPGRRKRNKTPWGKITAVVIGVLVVGAIGYYVYDTYFDSPSPVYARLGTSQGYIYAELFPACASRTVANFVNLTQSGFYNNLVWHRIVPGFVIQTGDPNTRGAVNSTRKTWGQGQSSHQVPFEWCGWLHNYAGYIGMASTAAKGPSTSQFFINLTNSTSNLSLDDNYTVFGKVISGMNVVCALASPTKDPTYPASNTALFSQPVNLASALLNNVTIISKSQAPAPQTMTQCKA